MRIALQAWYDAWLEEHRSTDLIYVARNARREVSLPQVHFVRDTLASLVWAGVRYCDHPREPAPRGDCRETAWVIGEHRSKSVRLPVYSLERPDLGIRLVLRNNYFDWKLTVISEVPIQSDLFPYLFKTMPPVEPEYTGDELAACYFEGFPKDLVFGYQATDPRRWSASLDDHALWTSVMICMRVVGAIKPQKWCTREEHRAQLEAESASATRSPTP
jgi:hypothetical protein